MSFADLAATIARIDAVLADAVPGPAALRVHSSCLPALDELRGLEWSGRPAVGAEQHAAALELPTTMPERAELLGEHLTGAWVDELTPPRPWWRRALTALRRLPW